MAYSFQKLNNGQIYVAGQGTFSESDAKRLFGYGGTTPAPAPKPPVNQTPQQQAVAIQTQLTDLQKQQAALAKYGLRDTNELTRDASGNYVPKPVDTSTLAGAAKNAAIVAGGGVQSAGAYKNSPYYQNLSAEAKEFIDLGYQTVLQGGDVEIGQLSEAIKNAIAVADPYYASQLRLAEAEIGMSMAESKGDIEEKMRIARTTRDRLAQDVSAESDYLSVEQQADLATALRGYDEDLLTIADDAAEKGLSFATGARSRILAEQRRGEQYQDVVQSSRREYNYKMNQLRVKAQRGDQDAASELADLDRQRTESLKRIGSAAETVLGSSNALVKGITGYAPVGGVTGNLEEQKRKSILEDVGSMMDLQRGFTS